MSDQSEAMRLAKWCDDMAAPPHSASKATYFQSTAAELRRQHSRIEADEALMRQALEALQESWRTDKGDAAITALRKRLEASNADQA